MAGIYIHIPFCKAKCHYCDFFSLATSRYREEYLEALLREIKTRKLYLNDDIIETIYFGGGTPSLFSAENLKLIQQEIANNFTLSKDPEITLEANPDDLGKVYLQSLWQAGINRLSIGVQSFRNADLISLNRAHNENQAIECLYEAKSVGFENLSIDLIYGIPGLSIESWEKNLEIFESLNIPHLSSYWLTVEAGTALAGFIRKGKYPSPDESLGASHFKHLMSWAKQHDYQHYEVSNYARNGKFSQHNTAYWNSVPYLGLGPSAHSFNGKSRQWNVSNLSLYIKGIHKGSPVFEKEIISDKQRFNEYIMTSLRTMWGCNLQYLSESFNLQWAEKTRQQAQKYIDNGWLKEESGIIYTQEEGWFHLDGISADLFLL